MIIDAHTAVVDNDFVNHLAESRIADDILVSVMTTAFSDLGVNATMHPLVYTKEVMHDNKRVSLLFQNKVIEKAEFSDIFSGSSAKKSYYLLLVSELYHSFTGDKLGATGEDILSYWVRQQSLGELHSLAMCLLCQCGMFLSDDNDSKKIGRLIEQKSLGKVIIYNRREFFEKHSIEGNTFIKKEHRRSLTHH